MKLLFIGPSLRLFSWLKKLGDSQRHTITHCPDGNQATLVLDQSSVDFDWIAIEGRETSGEGAVVARAVRAMGCGVPIVFLSSPDSANEREESPTLLCALERSPHGTRMLNCTMPAAGALARCGPTAEDIVFEFHAPCKTAGRGGG